MRAILFLAWTFYFTAASPAITPQHPGQTTLGVNGGSEEVLFGWHDPRLNGGRFLDVRLAFVLELIALILFSSSPHLILENLSM